MKKENLKTQRTILTFQEVVILLLFSIVFLSIFSGYSSFLFPKYSDYDSSIFMMIGRGLNSGKRLYTDIFDHKGPVLFWIEALGMMFGRGGIFALQCIFLWFDFISIWYISGKIGDERNRKQRFLYVVVFSIILAYPFANGNLSEEYCLPFIFLSLCFALSDYQYGKPKRIHSFFYGLFIGIIAFIRINNAIPIVGIILLWVIILIKQKKVKEVLCNIGIGILGICSVAIPICLWFALQEALYDMLFATFIFNFKYSSNGALLSRLYDLKTLVKTLILFAPIVVSVILVRKWDFTLLTCLTAISFGLGPGYNHYFMISVPVSCVGIGYGILRNNRNKMAKKILKIMGVCVVICYAFLSARIIYKNIDEYYISDEYQRKVNDIAEILAKIPDAERDNFVGFDVPASYYIYGEILPCYKYGILQSSWSSNAPEIMDAYVSELQSGNIHYLGCIPNNGNTLIEEIVSDRFQMVDRNDYLLLYKLVEE